MRRVWAVVAAVVWTACAVCAAEPNPSADAILKLLNSRVSGSPRRYAAAAQVVAEDARAGRVLQQYVLALVSDDEDLPASARPTAEERDQYLKAGRPRIERLAQERDNSLAWYLLYLEKRDPVLLEKAVKRGNVQALNALGTIQLMSVLEGPHDDPEAERELMASSFAYFKQAADTEDANGLNNLGLCHQNGYGCAKDEAAAFACFSKAAKMGHSEAVNNLGRFYREGIVVARDEAIALRCFRLSAGQGNFWGQVNYALALLRGEGAPADVARGVELLESIAGRGRAEAMDCLADCYAKGVGELKPDPLKAAVWTVRARAARGDRRAAEWLEEMHETTHDR